jgi:hypothetical protein
MRYISSVFLAILAGACISNLPILALFASGLVVAVSQPGKPDTTRSIWPDIVKVIVLLSSWTVPGAVNGALGISVDRGRANRWVFLPACAAVPVFMALAQLDHVPPRPFDFRLLAVSFVLAGFVWLAGEMGRMLGSSMYAAGDRARILSMATNEAAAFNDSASSLRASAAVVNARALLFTVAFVAGAGAASMYFIFMDRPDRQLLQDREVQNERRRTEVVRQDAEYAKERLRIQVTFERNGREQAEKRLEELMQAPAKKDPFAK